MTLPSHLSIHYSICFITIFPPVQTQKNITELQTKDSLRDADTDRKYSSLNAAYLKISMPSKL